MNQHDEGMKILEFGSDILKYRNDFSRDFGFAQAAEMKLVLWKIDRLAKTVPLENPRMCPKAI